MTAPADKYHTGDRVFAKLKGYPWWPAKVSYILLNNFYHKSFIFNTT